MAGKNVPHATLRILLRISPGKRFCTEYLRGCAATVRINIDNHEITFKRDLEDLSSDMNGVNTAKKGPTQLFEIRGTRKAGDGDTTSGLLDFSVFSGKTITIQVFKGERCCFKSEHLLTEFLQLRVENANLTKEISTVFEVDNRNSFTVHSTAFLFTFPNIATKRLYTRGSEPKSIATLRATEKMTIGAEESALQPKMLSREEKLRVKCRQTENEIKRVAQVRFAQKIRQQEKHRPLPPRVLPPRPSVEEINAYNGVYKNVNKSPSPRTDLGQKTEPVRMKPLDKQKPHPAFELLNKLFKISAFDRTEYVALKRLFAQKNKRVIRAYKKYLKKRKLRILTARFRRILATEDKENAVEAQIKKAKEDAENYKTREQLMDAYMGAVKKQNKPMIQISRGMLISAPIVPSFDIEAENRLNNLIERRKATKKTKTVPRHVVEKTLVQVNNLKASQIRERTSAEIADWAIKVGVEAKLLKSSMKKKEGLWDWRGRIEHDKIELQVHDAYIDYLHGKVSKFWMEVQ
jgi:hypothetical protein